jgi:hypothetical protein
MYIPQPELDAALAAFQVAQFMIGAAGDGRLLGKT